MPCMCGDTHCWSCGPAQGNWKCPICRAWADDGCEHISEETGELKAEFAAEAEEKTRQENGLEARLALQYEEEERLADEYWRTYDETKKAP